MTKVTQIATFLIVMLLLSNYSLVDARSRAEITTLNAIINDLIFKNHIPLKNNVIQVYSVPGYVEDGYRIETISTQVNITKGFEVESMGAVSANFGHLSASQSPDTRNIRISLQLKDVTLNCPKATVTLKHPADWLPKEFILQKYDGSFKATVKSVQLELYLGWIPHFTDYMHMSPHARVLWLQGEQFTISNFVHKESGKTFVDPKAAERQLFLRNVEDAIRRTADKWWQQNAEGPFLRTALNRRLSSMG